MAMSEISPVTVEPQAETALTHHSTIGEVASTRAAQEVRAAMIVAKQYPRDETAAIARINRACQRKALAEIAEYNFPRGGQLVRGASIRLAEVLAGAWGNIDSGFIELERAVGRSAVMAYAWDLETNTRSTRVFDVPHIRDRKESKGGRAFLTDSRDIYEMVANQAARRVRACILAIIPHDVQDGALDQCRRTLEKGHKEPLIDRVRAMVVAFAGLGVTQEMLAARLGHVIEATGEKELLDLRAIWTSVRDGMADVDAYFERAVETIPAAQTKSEAVAGRLRKRDEPAREPGDEAP